MHGVADVVVTNGFTGNAFLQIHQGWLWESVEAPKMLLRVVAFEAKLVLYLLRIVLGVEDTA